MSAHHLSAYGIARSCRHVGTCELSQVPVDTAWRRGSRLVYHASLQSRRGMMGAAILLWSSMILSPLARADLVSSRGHAG